MRKWMFLALTMLFVFQISGFEMKYNSYGENLNIPGVFDSPDGIHEKITKTAVHFLCEANDNGLEFINNNLSQFVDVSPISDCDELANSSIYDGVLYSLLRGVRYNDAPEVDGFTAMSDHSLYNWANTVDDSCNNAELCILFPITCAVVCGIAATSDFDKDDFLISEESDLSNEYLYPLMHAQLNNRNFGNNPHLIIKVMRNYIKSYFYELLLLSLTEEKQFQNYFISYDDVDQHSSSSATEYKEIDYKKVILGELFHTIEDSFAHNIRYLENGKLKIGAILNMDTTLFGEFKHDKYFPIDKNETNDYSGLDDSLPYFNCKDVDGIFNFNFDDEIENGMPLNLQGFDGGEVYFWQNFYKGKKVIKESYASTMAVHSISEFLWILGKAIEMPNDKNYTNALVNNYLNRWFSGFEEGETPFFDLDPEKTKDLPEEYELISSESRWENFYNVDLWEHSFVKDRTVNLKKAVFLPWIDIKSRKRDRLSEEDQSDRFVFKTVENLPSQHNYYVPNSSVEYDDITKTMTFQNSSLTLMWSWIDGNDNETVDFSNQEKLRRFFVNGKKISDYAFVRATEELVLTISENRLTSNNMKMSPAALFIPRGFKVCLLYDKVDSVPSIINDKNDGARFSKMPTYRCFYGGEKGRLIAGGKEDALKPGTKIFALPIDSDGDSLYSWNDNCPTIYNPGQWDWNNDGKGNACQDYDNDGTLDADDNCRSEANSDQADYDEDGVGDVCDNCPVNYNPNQADTDPVNGIYDKVGDACDRCSGVFSEYKKISPNNELISARTIDGYSEGAALLGLGFYSPDRKYFSWQPDHDLDGTPDACDTNQSGNDGFAYSRINNVKGLGPTPPIDGISSIFAPRINNFKARIGVSMPKYSGNYSVACPDGVCNIAVHYCSIGKEDVDNNRWGEDKFCTTTEKTDNPLYKETSSNKFTCDFGFSHGSDNYKVESIQRWEKRITTQDVGLEYVYSSNDPNDDPSRAKLKKKGSTTNNYDWNWRRDWYVENGCLESPGKEICQSLKNAAVLNESFTMYYSLSTNVASEGQSFTYTDQAGTKHINGLYFGKANIYSRSNRYGIGGKNTGMMKLNYYQVPANITIPDKIDDVDLEIDYCRSCYWNVDRRLIIGSDGVPIPEAYSNNIGRWSVERINSSYNLNAQQMYMPKNIKLIAEVDDQNMYAVTTRLSDVNSQYASTEYELRFNTNESGVDWNRIGMIENWDTDIINVSGVAEKDGRIYFVAKKSADNSNYLFVIEPPAMQPIGGDTCSSDLPVYNLSEIGELEINETGLEKIKILTVNNRMYLTGSNPSDNSVQMFALERSGELTKLSEINPPARTILNLGKSERYIFLTGGVSYNNESMNDMWRFDTVNEIWEQVPTVLNGDFRKAISQIVDGKLVFANPVINGNVNHAAIEIDPSIENVADITISNVEIPVTEVEYENQGAYCLNESDTLLNGGLEMSGTCIPFSHSWYKQFSTGSTVYSIAGKGDRLYVGTSNSIKVYDISNPDALTLKYTFSTNSRIVYDLEIADGDVMYAATSKGLYKLSTANPDTLSVIGSFYSTGSYNYQYKIQLYNDKLYVGDDNGINIRNKDTFARLSYVNIGSVLDFAIANGEIAMYWSAFWDEGIQIRGVDALNMKAYDYATCYTGELATDHGAFYLSCDDYEYRFAGLPNTYLDYFPVDGDIREMQENYAYNGWAYISDGSYVKLSTSNDVPAVCGNGVTEPGELCDGSSVECTTFDPDYTGGSAACNSTCNGYNENNCETDGW